MSIHKYHGSYVRPVDNLDTFYEADRQEVMAVMYFLQALKRRGLIKQYVKVHDNMTCVYSLKHMVVDFYSVLMSKGIKCFNGAGRRIHQDSAAIACQKMYFDSIRRPNDGDFNADGWYNYVALFRLDPKGKYGVAPRLGKIIAEEIYEEARYLLPLLKGTDPKRMGYDRSHGRFYKAA